jgi:hypothetical protein
MKDSSNLENSEYEKRTGDKTGQFASTSNRKSGGSKGADGKRTGSKRGK